MFGSGFFLKTKKKKTKHFRKVIWNNVYEKILGLDISTSITGATIIQDGNIIENFIWDTRNKRKFPTLYEKAALINTDLRTIKKKHDITNIYIEQSLQSFRSGFSSAKTLSTLSSF